MTKLAIAVPAVQISDPHKTSLRSPWVHRKVEGGKLIELVDPRDQRVFRCNVDFRVPGQIVRESYSPRHHHNFDQIRFIISGQLNGSVDSFTGTCAYHPEGVFYGPQSNEEKTIPEGQCVARLILQTQGPTFAPFHTKDEIDAASQKIIDEGLGRMDRDAGVVTWQDGMVQDGYEAAWERATGEKLVYPRGRFADPVVIKTEAFEWCASNQAQGVWVKPLARFNASGPKVKVVKLDPGAKLPAGCSDTHQVVAVLVGCLQYEGTPVVQSSLVYCPPESAYGEMFADAESLLLFVEYQPRGGFWLD